MTRKLVILTRNQLHHIAHELGLGPEDVRAFWQLACNETDRPGGLAAKHRAEAQRLMPLFTNRAEKET